MADNILEMRNISKTFPGVKALQQVDLSVERGEVHAICGENGAGKSTLMKVLSGIYPYGGYEGEIVYEGQTARFHGIGTLVRGVRCPRNVSRSTGTDSAPILGE